MDLTYITRTDRDDDARPYEVHFLVDMDTQRAYGYVENPTPGTQQIMFVASLYGAGDTRRYLTLEAAKSYLEACAIEADMKECADLASSIGEPTKEQKKVESAL